ncbi:MAG: tRNA-dihydrouridine synthase [Myxococcota bacterium]|nr:tRNA-dihydrouridine synthase [Myxococcota bacterium]
MAGITNPPFRKLCKEMGAAFTVTELISAHALVFLSRKSSKKCLAARENMLLLIDRFEGEYPYAVQLFGRDPDVLCEAAQFIEARGVDIIDLNFGCPARKIIKGGQGAGVALMREPALLQAIAGRVVQAVSIPVTAKIRTGWSADDRNAPEVARRLADVGIQAICVHARTREQVHAGPVDLDTLAATCRSVSIPIIGNGGIRSPEDADRMIKKTGCQRVAIGQGAKGNPWLFRDLYFQVFHNRKIDGKIGGETNGKIGGETGGKIGGETNGKIGGETDGIIGGEIGGKMGRWAAPDLAERLSVFKRHLDLYVSWVGEDRAAREMRKHACWYLKGFDRAASFRKRLAEATDVAAYQRLIDDIPV